jgi:NAD(P)-dependent dehydrogenase (short-subunit alcohol dehydrogenase family)
MLDDDGVRHPLAKFAHVINVYLNSAFAVISQAAEEMAKNEPLTRTSAGSSSTPPPPPASKACRARPPTRRRRAGIIGMTLTIARDLAEHGIRMMAIAPGPFFSPLLRGGGEHLRDDRRAAQEQWGSTVPNPKRKGDPDEYAILAAQIVENDYLNGTTIRLDGALRL